MKYPSGPSPRIGPRPAIIGHMLPPPFDLRSTIQPSKSSRSAAAIASWIWRANAVACSGVPLKAPTRTEPMLAGNDSGTSAGGAHDRSGTKIVVPAADR